jgi:hypothetical protein
MLRPEIINWKDSNLAMFGSDLEKKIKEAAAAGENAWDGLGKEVTLRVWRIEKFKIVAWPKNKYGKVRTTLIVYYTNPCCAPTKSFERTILAYTRYISSTVSHRRLVYRAKLVQEGPHEAQVVT